MIMTFADVFDIYCQEYPATKGEERKPSQVREKYTEIAEAVGVDLSLLKQCRRGNAALPEYPNGNGPNAPYQFPEEDLDFVINLLKNHTSPSMKALRKADFSTVPLKERRDLISGFSSILTHLGHPYTVVDHQCRVMQLRLHYDVDNALEALRDELDSLFEDIELKVNNEFPFLTPEDLTTLISFTQFRIDEVHTEFSRIWDCYRDIRIEEITDKGLAEAGPPGNDNERKILDELVVEDALSKHEEYQTLLKERDALLDDEGFVKAKSGQWKYLCSIIATIEKTVALELLGRPLEPYTPKKMVLKHPKQVLSECLEYLKEMDKPSLPREPLTEKEVAEVQAIIQQLREGHKRPQ